MEKQVKRNAKQDYRTSFYHELLIPQYRAVSAYANAGVPRILSTEDERG